MTSSFVITGPDRPSPLTSRVPTATQRTAGQGETIPSTPTTTSATDTQAASRQALAAVTQVAKATRSARSAAAGTRLSQLLLMVKVLCLVGGDPKTVAHQAAQLAKEIGDQARAFSADGGGDPLPLETTGATPTAETDEAATETTGQQQLMAEADQAETTAQSVATASSTTAPAPSGIATSGAAGTSATDKSGKSDPDDSVITDPAAARRAFVDRLIATGASVNFQSSTLANGQTLFGQVKQALSALKGLVDRTAIDSHDKKKSLKTIHDAEKDVDVATNTIGQPCDCEISTAVARATDVMA